MRYMKASPVTALGLLALCFESACADDALENDSNRTLRILYGSEPAAKMIGGKAKAVLVFPHISKAGIVIGRQRGEGVLLMRGKRLAHYHSAAASHGLQAGVQSFGYALFLMNDNALQYLDKNDGWEIGAGPSVVIVDKGMAKSLTMTTLNDDVYAFIFDHGGRIAALDIRGSKIIRLETQSHDPRWPSQPKKAGSCEQAAIGISKGLVPP
jgi:lipid-binding SYLF domain-containing protein